MRQRSKLQHLGTTIFTVMSRLATEKGAVNLGQGFPDFEPPAELLDCVARHFRARHNQYAPMAGVPALLEQIAEHSHWCAFEDIRITKLSDTRMRMRTLNCTAQKAATKWGMDCYECGPGGLKLRSGFFGWIDPRARVTPVFTPPQKAGEGMPTNASCEWLISIE